MRAGTLGGRAWLFIPFALFVVLAVGCKGGGTVDGFTQTAPGLSVFEEGEEVIMFLEPYRETYVPIGIGIGEYEVRSTKGGRKLVTTASSWPDASPSIIGGPYWKPVNSASSWCLAAMPAFCSTTGTCPFMPDGYPMRIFASWAKEVPWSALAARRPIAKARSVRGKRRDIVMDPFSSGDNAKAR